MKKQYFFFLIVNMLVACTPLTPSVTISPAAETVNAPVIISQSTPNVEVSDLYLSSAEQERWQQVVFTNGGCALPCFLGITPGLTKWEEAKQIIGKIGANISSNPGGFYENTNWPIYGVPLNTNNPEYGAALSDISITVGDGAVQILKLYAEAHTGTAISQIWTRYSPEKVFSEFGKPSEIYFDIYMRDLERFPDYSILLLYKEDKAAFWFTGRSNTGKDACPHIQENGEITNLEISIANAKSQLDIFPPGWEFWSRRDEKDFLTTEEVFGLTKEEFYQRMLADPTTCFNVVP